MFCFGWNGHGQLGFGDTALRDRPTELTDLQPSGAEGVPGGRGPEPGENLTVVDVFAGAWNSLFIVKTSS